MSIPPCKSPTHKRYADALEGLYIQTNLALRDLSDLMAGAALISTEQGSRKAGAYIRNHDRMVREVEARLAFGRSELDEASRLVDEHLARNCRSGF